MKYIVTLVSLLSFSSFAGTVTFDIVASNNTNQTLSTVRADLGQTILVEKEGFKAHITATEHQKPSVATQGRTALKLEGKIIDRAAKIIQTKKLITLEGEPAQFSFVNANGETINLILKPRSVQ